MENSPMIDFYTNKDEKAFLEAWQAKVGQVSEADLDDLYQTIAESIKSDLENGKHELGKAYYYQDVLLGQSDYNEFYDLYLFSQD